MTNMGDRIYANMCLFAGISKRQRTTTTLCIRLHTAEVGGSNPASPTHFPSSEAWPCARRLTAIQRLETTSCISFLFVLSSYPLRPCFRESTYLLDHDSDQWQLRETVQ